MKLPDNTQEEFNCKWDTEKGELVFGVIVFYTGHKDKGLILNNCPFCGASLRPPKEEEIK